VIDGVGTEAVGTLGVEALGVEALGVEALGAGEVPAALVRATIATRQAPPADSRGRFRRDLGTVRPGECRSGCARRRGCTAAVIPGTLTSRDELTGSARD
jgi:hypothetical protein